MRRALVLTMLLAVLVRALSGQTLATLQVRIVLLDAAGRATPVARHALLVSDNPQTMSTRRVLTNADGIAELRLRAGNYTVESDQTIVFEGRAYSWTQRLDIVEGLDVRLELTAANAESEPVVPGAQAVSAPDEATSLLALDKWRESVVAIWSPLAHASGFVIDASQGLIATNQQPLGGATAVEVQLSPSVKVSGNVVATDRERDVAILRIDPAVLTSMQAVPLDCGRGAPPLLTSGLEIVAIGAELFRGTRLSFGTVSRVDGRSATADLAVGPGATGGPVFTAAGELMGLTVSGDPSATPARGNTRVVRVGEVCAVVADARTAMAGVAAPSGARLPVEPLVPVSTDMLESAAKRRAGGLEPYRVTTPAFDVAVLTPLHTYVAQSRPNQDFSNWSDYVAGNPSVLLVRVTPKLSESVWAKVARGAALTQGLALPKIQRFQSGFLKMRALCGQTEVAPIHPFRIERRVSPTEAVYEGLYVFEVDALGPHCGTVTLTLYSEKEPNTASTQVVDPALLQRIWSDLGPYRASDRRSP